MSRSAQVRSTDVLRAMRLALKEYEAEVRDAIEQLLLEARRAVDWIEQDRSRYWPRQARKASDDMQQARNDLERCEMAIRPDDRRSCYEQKIALEAAKRRLRLCEQKVRATKKWRVEVHHETEEFLGRMAKMINFLDNDLPRALATLERMAKSLDKYTGQTAPQDASPNSSEKNDES